MNKTEKDQVDLDQLIFTLNWEDPRSDIRALQIESGDSVMSITSGCCNTIEFLLYDPSVIYSVDINPAQSFLMDLKLNAIKYLNYEEFVELMGLVEGKRRIEIYKEIRSYLDNDSQLFWNQNESLISKGIIMQGRYEKFVRLAGKMIRLLQGRQIVENVFKNTSPEEQVRYFDQVFNTRRFRLLFRLLFNKRMLAKKGLNADYFHFDDGSQSFAESFFNRAQKVLKEILIKDNYFLSLYLTGDYQNRKEVPNYFKKEYFSTLKDRIDRIRVITMDAKQWFKEMPDNSINCFSLSNICELKSEQDTESLFKEVARVGCNQSRTCFRNLMVPRSVPPELRTTIKKNKNLSSELIKGDRSFVYGKVASYIIEK